MARVPKADKDKEFSLKNNKDRDRVYKNFSSEQKEFFDSIKTHIFTFNYLVHCFYLSRIKQLFYFFNL